MHEATEGDSSSGIAVQAPAPIVLFDTLREAHLAVIGREIVRLAGDTTLFAVGSSGIEYALVAHWREAAKCGEPMGQEGRGPSSLTASPGLRPTTPITASVPPVDQLLSVSGSCSPVTDRQIARALEAGFREISVHPRQLVRAGYTDAIRTAVLLESQRTLAGSRGVILHTSRGPGDARIVRGRKTLAALSANLGPNLARLLEDLVEATGIRRAVVCGGDTSMAVARALGIVALEYVAPIAPGCPLCRVHAPGRMVHGCEIAFKGGQVGRDRFFQDALGDGEK